MASGTIGMADGGTVIQCAWHRGCSTFYQGSPYANTRGTRQEARRDGWLVGQDGGRALRGGGTLRLDYCAEHAACERERRGLRTR